LLHEFICGCERSERKDIDDDSLMRTPSVVDSTGGAISEKQARERGRMVKVADQAAQLAFDNGLKVSESVAESLLPTPTLGHLRNHDEPVEDYLQRRQDFIDGRTKGMPGASLGVAVRMETLPTPTVAITKNGGSSSPEYKRARGSMVTLKDEVEKGNDIVLPTPKALDGVKGNLRSSQERLDSGRQVDLPNVAIDLQDKQTNWGKFEPAIRRWEQHTRPAPAPTKPDGKDGNHRLSSLFTEWMMGLPVGWVTGHGLKRNDELKMCGNGVVPQQAVLALRYLLGETDIPKA